MSIRARPTTYKGIEMRSRLEAGFAAWLDTQGHPWLYEPRAYADGHDQYLPDFQIGHEFVEVKPEYADVRTALRRMHVIRASEPRALLLVVVGEWRTDLWDNGTYRFHVAARCHDRQLCPPCARSTAT